MISVKKSKKFCREDISLIENYKQAISDNTQTWHCHHRDEVKILPSGIKVIRTRKELIENGRYYHCPANELIFITPFEHISLHHKGKICKQVSKETRMKQSKKSKGRKHTKETKQLMSEHNWMRTEEGKAYFSQMKTDKPTGRSEFGMKYFEHYGYCRKHNNKQYLKEQYHYRKYGKCSWEV